MRITKYGNNVRGMQYLKNKDKAYLMAVQGSAIRRVELKAVNNHNQNYKI